MASRALCWLGSLLVVFISTASGEAACVLHPFLTGTNSWKYQRGISTTTFRFRDGYLNETTFSPLGEVELSRTCMGSFPDNRYVFRWLEDGASLYHCIELVPVSRNVIVVKHGPTEYTKAAAESHCLSVIPLTHSDWPLLNTIKHPNEGNQCGIEGGFDFFVEIKGVSEYCKNTDNSLQPRLEVGCDANPGLSFNFHNNFNCRGYLDMRLEQTLMCMGSWERGPYKFSLVTDANDFLPNIWLLRFPKDAQKSANFNIHMFPHHQMDMEKDPVARVRPYIHTLVMNRLDFPTICEDEAKPVACGKVCQNQNERESELDDIHCMKSCNKCPQARQDCSFPTATKGEWEEPTESGSRHVAVAASMLYVEGKPPLKCLNLSGSTWIHYSQPVVSIYRNGCKPKYACVYLRRRGPNVMQYGVNDMIDWPYKTNINGADICDVDWPSTFKIAKKKKVPTATLR